MKNYVITIAREYASGAGEIAKKLALELGIKVYDKEMISLAAKESGLAEAVVAESEQKRTNSFLIMRGSLWGQKASPGPSSN